MTHNDDLSPEEYKRLSKYFKRTGIFRVYLLLRPPADTQLMLEFVIRGEVLFTVKLWKRRRNILSKED